MDLRCTGLGCRILVCVYGLVLSDGAQAGVTLDGTLGPAGSLAGPAYTIPAQVGDTRGANLFHSFGQFSVGRGESATFTGPANIQNIIGRVTGGEVSSIDGLLRSSIRGANLYLINPSGVVFGPNASLDVSGSFYASTADYLSMAGGGRFDARNPGASVLTSAPPAAFGFLGAAAPISVAGSLSVSSGKTLGLIGGDLAINGGQASLTAPSGRIDLVATAAAGTIALTAPDTAAFTNLGSITVNGGAVVSTAGDPGGTINIRGGRLVIESAMLDSGTLGATDHPGVGIDIGVRGLLSLAVSSDLALPDALIDSSAQGAGRAGSIVIAANSIQMSGDATRSAGTPSGRFAAIASDAGDSGRGGDIRINAGAITVGSNASIHTGSTGPGAAGDIDISATSLFVDGRSGDGSFIGSTGHGGGAGNLNILAVDVLLQGSSGVSNDSGLMLETEDKSVLGLDGGSLTMTAERLRVLDGAQISTVKTGSGSGGDVTITAGQVTIAGVDGTGIAAGVFSTVIDSAAGTTANINLNANTLELSHYGVIDSESGSRTSGNIHISAQELSISDGALLSLHSNRPEFGDLTIAATRMQLSGGTGAPTGIEVGPDFRGGRGLLGGGIRIDSADLRVFDGASIRNSTPRNSRVPIEIHADHVLVAGRDAVTGDSASISAGAPLANAAAASPVADDIYIEAGDLTVRDRGVISVESQSFGSMPAHLHVVADEILLSGGALSANSSYLSGSGSIDVVSHGALTVRDSDIAAVGVNSGGGDITLTAGTLLGIERSTIRASIVGQGGGDGGNVHLNAASIALSGHSTIAANAAVSDANGGNIDLLARDVLSISNSDISAQAGVAAAPGNPRMTGGNIKLAAGSLINLRNATVAASMLSSLGNGGNVAIDPELVVLSGTRIAADAFGGNGGNITIVAGNLFASPDTTITASSLFGVQGHVVIRAPTQDLSGDLAELPETAIDAASRFRSTCAAIGSKFSSFVVARRSSGGAAPGWLLPSAYAGVERHPASLGMGNGRPGSGPLLARAAGIPSTDCRF